MDYGCDILSRRLKRWGVPQIMAERLSRRHSASLDLLTLTPVELLNITNRNPDFDRRHVTDVIVNKRAPRFQSASQMKDNSSQELPLRTSLKEVDEALGGGLTRGSITELVGPPGAGKTQFCLMMAGMTANDQREKDKDDNCEAEESDQQKDTTSELTSEANSESNIKKYKRVAYVDTEGAFCAKRLLEMESKRLKGRFWSSDSDAEWIQGVGERVMVYYAPTCDKLVEVLAALDVDVVKYG